MKDPVRRDVARSAITGFVIALVLGVMALPSPGSAAEEAAANSAPPVAATAAGPAIDPALLMGAQLRLGGNLLGKLAAGKKDPQSNFVVSPASVAMVFSLLDLGANDPMRQAIRRTLGFGDARHTSKADLAAVRAIATSVLRRANEGGPLALANIIVFDPDSKANPQALDGLRAAGADVREEPLDKPETIALINGWVKDRTRGLIPTILDEPLDKGGLVAVNALYFKDRWKAPFDPAATRDDKFSMTGGHTIDVPMMHAEGRFAFRQNDRFVAVALSYASADYELVVVTSKDAPLELGGFKDTVSWLDGKGFDVVAGELALPRFSVSGSEELLPTLDALGLGAARKQPGAFKGFSAVAQTISRVVQKTELRINEEGTEAAAATAVTTLRSVAPSPSQYVKMIVDKPFMFALRDKRAGLVLLQGYVTKPGARADAKAQ